MWGTHAALNLGKEAERHAAADTVVRHDEVDDPVRGDVVDQPVLPHIYCQLSRGLGGSQVSFELLGGILDRIVILAAVVSA